MSERANTKRKPNQPGAGGKVANDVNKAGLKRPTQKNQGRRTPMSRSDRLALRGADNQSHSRRSRPALPSEPKSGRPPPK